MRIAVLGAGVAGLYAAYRLRQQGHNVTVLEAKSHAGGLSQTARTGSVVTEHVAGDLVQQTARLSPGQFVNLGPGRLPHHHRRILGLCRELGVPLEPYVMSSDANLYADTYTRQVFPRRRLEADMRGYLAAAAYPHLSYEARGMARLFGDLTAAGTYTGTGRAPGKPLQLAELAALAAGEHQFHQPRNHLWQDTMFHPVGGMDAIWRYLLDQVGHNNVVFNAPVHAVTTSKLGAKVQWTVSGWPEQATFDWCLSSVPLPLLDGLDLQGFSADYRRAVGLVPFAAASKVGWETTSRWWQNDQYQIYGGISYTDADIWQVWYPSTGYADQRGTLTGAYNSYATAERFGAMGVGERLRAARQQGALLHPEIGDDEHTPLHLGLTVAWQNVPYQAGGWAAWHPDTTEHQFALTTLARADGRFVTIGDQMGDWPGWQESCVQSVDHALGLLGHPEGAIEWEEDVPREVPDSWQLTAGDHPTL